MNALTIQRAIWHCLLAINGFLSSYVTMDATWIHHFTLESHRQSAEWRAAGENATVNSQIIASATITFRYWRAWRTKFQKPAHEEWRKNYFHQDNAPWKQWPNWTSWASICFLIHRSPDLVTSEYSFFADLTELEPRWKDLAWMTKQPLQLKFILGPRTNRSSGIEWMYRTWRRFDYVD